MSKLRKSLLPVLVMGVFGFIALSVAEFAARSLFPDWAPRTGRLAQFWQYDALLGWAHVPGRQGEFESAGFSTRVRINSHGYRGPERSYDRDATRRRVVVLGDSFVWGFGVEEEETFTTLLEREAAGALEVINLGVSGYSSDQELLVYRQTARRYDPDTVVLVVASNDVAMNAAPIAYLIYGKPVFVLDGDELRLTNTPVPEVPWMRRMAVDLAGRSYLLNQANRLREEWNVSRALKAAPPEPAATGTPAAERPFPKTMAEQVTIRLIEQIGAEVQADGRRLLVVLVEGIYGGPRFGVALRQRGLDVVELDAVMRFEDPAVHLPDELHWNADGHAIVARTLLPYLTGRP